MNLKELKDKIDELWNKADVETKVNSKVYDYDIETENYYSINDVYADESKDIIMEIDSGEIV